MKAILLLIFVIFSLNSFSQSKKDQILRLTQQLDSVKQVLNLERTIAFKNIAKKDSIISIGNKQVEKLNDTINGLNAKLSASNLELINRKNQIEELSQKDKANRMEISRLKNENASFSDNNQKLNSEKKQLNNENILLKEEIEHSKKLSEFINMRYNSDDYPYTDLGFKINSDSEIIKISTVSGYLSIISFNEYANFEIPQNAKSAIGGWWAGAGDYFYFIEENGIPTIYQGWQDEGQVDAGFHWEKFKEITEY